MSAPTPARTGRSDVQEKCHNDTYEEHCPRIDQRDVRRDSKMRNSLRLSLGKVSPLGVRCFDIY